MAIGQMLIDTISHAAVSGVDSDGQLTYATATSVAAKVQERDEEVSAGTEQSVTYRAEIITLTQIRRGDRVWLPGDSSSSTDLAHTPASVQSATGIGSGETVYKVML